MPRTQSRKLMIGAVIIRRKNSSSYLGLMGDERVAALSYFYRTGQPPEGLEALSYDPEAPITWDEVDWESAGARVTGS